MTDPGTADRTYIGPMTPDLVEEIIAKVSLQPTAPGRRISASFDENSQSC